MDFRPFRSLHQVPGLSILEGITTLKNPAFPHILLAITTILFQTPHAAPTFVFTSLPILIHLAESQFTWGFAKRTLGPLTGYLTVDSFTTTRDLLASTGQVLFGQSALSAGIALTSWLAVLLHRQAIRGGALLEGNWDTTLAFGLLWAGAWLAFSWISPFGRYVGSVDSEQSTVDVFRVSPRPSQQTYRVSCGLTDTLAPPALTSYLVQQLMRHTILGRTYAGGDSF